MAFIHHSSFECSFNEQRRRILDTLKTKLDFANHLFRGMLSIPARSPTVLERVEALWNASVYAYYPGISEKVGRYVDIDRRMRMLVMGRKDRIQNTDSAQWDRYFLQDGEEEEQRIEALQKQKDELLVESEDLEIIGRMRAAVDNLLAKQECVQQLPQDMEGMIRWVAEQKITPVEIREEEVRKVIRGLFSVSIVLSSREYERVWKDKSRGLHCANTPINFIRDDDPEILTAVIHHEDIHNVTDGQIVTEDPSRLFLARMTGHQLTKERYGEFSKSYDMQREYLLGRIGRSRDYLNKLHGELLAAFKQAEAKGFTDDEGILLSEFERAAFSFSTAGKYAVGLIKSIQNEYEKQSDKRLRQVLSKLQTEIRQKFLRTVRNMENCLLIARIYGECVRDEVEMLFFLLQPTRYSHIVLYLEEFYDPDVSRKMKALDGILRFVTLEELHDGMRLIGQLPSALVRHLQQCIVSHVIRIEREGILDRVEDFGITSIEKKREAVALLTRLSIYCRKHTAILDFARDIEFAFFVNFIEQDIDRDFFDLPVLCSELNRSERDELSRAFEIYKEFMAEDLGLETFAEVKKSSAWKVLESLGFAECIK